MAAIVERRGEIDAASTISRSRFGVNGFVAHTCNLPTRISAKVESAQPRYLTHTKYMGRRMTPSNFTHTYICSVQEPDITSSAGETFAAFRRSSLRPTPFLAPQLGLNTGNYIRHIVYSATFCDRLESRTLQVTHTTSPRTLTKFPASHPTSHAQDVLWWL